MPKTGNKPDSGKKSVGKSKELSRLSPDSEVLRIEQACRNAIPFAIDKAKEQSIAEKNNATKKEVAEIKGSGGSGRGGKRAEYVAYDKDGNPHYFTSKAAQEQFAKQQGTWEYGSSTGYKLDEKGTKQRVSSGGYARTPKETKEKEEQKQEKKKYNKPQLQ